MSKTLNPVDTRHPRSPVAIQSKKNSISLHYWPAALVVLLMLAMTFRIPDGPSEFLVHRNFFPLFELIRTRSEILLAVISALICALLVIHVGVLNGPLYLTSAAWAFIAFRTILCFRRMYDDFDILPEVVAVVVITSVLLLFCSWFRRRPNSEMCLALIDSVYWFGLILLVANGIQLAYDPTAVVHKGRLWGISVHPNEFGIVFACVAVTAIFKFFYYKRQKVALLASIAFTICVVLSGSRTAGLALVAGILPLIWTLRRTSSKAFIGSLIGTVTILFLSFYFSSLFELSNESRVLSVGDTRSGTFQLMWENFASNPILGKPSEGGGTSNSWLFAASSAGFPGLILFAASFILAFPAMAKMRLQDKAEKTEFSTLILALYVSLFVSSLFSGFLLELIQPNLILFLMLLCLSPAKIKYAGTLQNRKG